MFQESNGTTQNTLKYQGLKCRLNVYLTEFLDGTKKGRTAKMEVKDLGKLVYTKDDKV